MSPGPDAPFVGIARRLRSAAYRAAAPIDFLFRAMNGLHDYPPLHLRRHVGAIGSGFNGPAYEFVAYLRLLASLRDGDRVWDLGCGCGLLEIALEDLGWRGRLVGSDVHAPCVAWARRRLEPRFADHRFVHMDVFNAAYWPRGRASAREWLSRFDERDFDVVVAKSFFTHVLPDEIGPYLEGIAARLRPGGKALVTFFVFDLGGEPATGASRIEFEPYAEGGRCAVRSRAAPTAAVAYDRTYLLDRLRGAGFATEALSLHRGSWSGRAGGLSFQDVVVVEKR